MKKSLIYSLLFGALALAGCSPKVTSTLIKAKEPLEPEEELAIVQPDQEVPEGSVILETMKLTGKDYDELVGMAAEKARAAGGEVLKIVEHLNPDITSPRHRVSALALSADDSDSTITSSSRVAADVIESNLDLRKESWSIRIAVQGGASYRIGKEPQGVDALMSSHIKNRRWGVNYAADVTVFISENIGVGIKAQNVYYGDKMPASANGKNGFLEDYENIWFAGPVFTFRLPSNNRNNAFLARAGYGFAGYSDWGKAVVEPSYTITGIAPGLLLEAGYDFGITKNLSVGAAFTFVTGALRNATTKYSNGKKVYMTLDKEKAESLRSIGLSIGLRYNL